MSRTGHNHGGRQRGEFPQGSVLIGLVPACHHHHLGQDEDDGDGGDVNDGYDDDDDQGEWRW